MDLRTLHDHLDARLDRLEDKMDRFSESTNRHTSQIEHLQGFAKLAVSILLACSGFFAVAYFNR